MTNLITWWINSRNWGAIYSRSHIDGWCSGRIWKFHCLWSHYSLSSHIQENNITSLNNCLVGAASLIMCLRCELGSLVLRRSSLTISSKIDLINLSISHLENWVRHWSYSMVRLVIMHHLLNLIKFINISRDVICIMFFLKL